MTLIIPFTSAQLTWHLQNNVMEPLNEQTIEKIVEQCNLVNMGERSLNDTLSPNTSVTISEMLTDLRIDFNN